MYNLEAIYTDFLSSSELVENISLPTVGAAHDTLMSKLEDMGLPPRSGLELEALINEYTDEREKQSFFNGFKVAVMMELGRKAVRV